MSKNLTCDDLWATTIERFDLPLLPDRSLMLDLIAVSGPSHRRLQLKCTGIRSLAFTEKHPPVKSWDYIELSAVTCKRDSKDQSLWAVQLDIWGTTFIDLVCKKVDIVEI